MEQEEARAAVERYGPMVYRLALAQTHSAHDADDVFQEVFLRYVRGAPDFTEEEHRKAWLLRVTANCCKKLRGSFWNKHTVSLSEAIPAQNEGASCWSCWTPCRRSTGRCSTSTTARGMPPTRSRPSWAAGRRRSAASSPGDGLCCGTRGKERKTYDGTGLSQAL